MPTVTAAFQDSVIEHGQEVVRQELEAFHRNVAKLRGAQSRSRKAWYALRSEDDILAGKNECDGCRFLLM